MIYRMDPAPEPGLMDWPGLRKVWPLTVVRLTSWHWLPELHWGGCWYM
jgi:hypothetical protein